VALHLRDILSRDDFAKVTFSFGPEFLVSAARLASFEPMIIGRRGDHIMVNDL
jgi:hypothetical protein